MSLCIPFVAKLFGIHETYSKNGNLNLMLLLTPHMLLLTNSWLTASFPCAKDTNINILVRMNFAFKIYLFSPNALQMTHITP